MGIKTAISAAQGVVVFLIMGYVLNVRMSHLFGVLHFVLNYIPTAGPIIATFLPLPIVILDPELGLTAKIAAFAAPTAVHMVVGNLLEPLVFGSSMELHPVTVIMALALFYVIWGVAGAILAVPVTAVIRIILSSIDHPYAHIVINVLEGRLSAATAEFDMQLEAAALDSSSTASGMGMGMGMGHVGPCCSGAGGGLPGSGSGLPSSASSVGGGDLEQGPGVATSDAGAVSAGTTSVPPLPLIAASSTSQLTVPVPGASGSSPSPFPAGTPVSTGSNGHGATGRPALLARGQLGGHAASQSFYGPSGSGTGGGEDNLLVGGSGSLRPSSTGPSDRGGYEYDDDDEAAIAGPTGTGMIRLGDSLDDERRPLAAAASSSYALVDRTPLRGHGQGLAGESSSSAASSMGPGAGAVGRSISASSSSAHAHHGHWGSDVILAEAGSQWPGSAVSSSTVGPMAGVSTRSLPVGVGGGVVRPAVGDAITGPSAGIGGTGGQGGKRTVTGSSL